MKWMRERKWYLKTMAVGFIGSFFLLFLFYRQAALCFLGAVLGSVCYVRYRIKVQKEQEKWQLMVEFKEAMDIAWFLHWQQDTLWKTPSQKRIAI